MPTAGPDGAAVRTALISVSDDLGETPTSRSEPDVVLVADTLVMCIEAKTHSRNEHDPGAAGWSLYLDDQSRFAARADVVQAAGYYELARSWVIGNRLADSLGRDFALVNLGPQKLTDSAQAFAALAATTPSRTFAHVRWAALLDAARPLRDWLDTYVRERGLSGL